LPLRICKVGFGASAPEAVGLSTAQLYDHGRDEVSLDEVERIVI
jgi:hypothetical protein